MNPLDLARSRLNNVCVGLTEKYQVNPSHPLIQLLSPVALPISQDLANIPRIAPHLSGRIFPALQLPDEAAGN